MLPPPPSSPPPPPPPRCYSPPLPHPPLPTINARCARQRQRIRHVFVLNEDNIQADCSVHFALRCNAGNVQCKWHATPREAYELCCSVCMGEMRAKHTDGVGHKDTRHDGCTTTKRAQHAPFNNNSKAIFCIDELTWLVPLYRTPLSPWQSRLSEDTAWHRPSCVHSGERCEGVGEVKQAWRRGAWHAKAARTLGAN